MALRVLVVGRSVEGLALARALQLQCRRAVRLFLWDGESKHEHRFKHGVTMQPPAMRMLWELGVSDSVMRIGRASERFTMLDKSGTVLLDVPLRKQRYQFAPTSLKYSGECSARYPLSTFFQLHLLLGSAVRCSGGES